MASKLRPIGRPNYIGIAGMRASDIVTAREYYIVRLVEARRRNDSDTLEAAIDWVVALTSEMRLRGGSAAKDEVQPLVSL